MGKTKARARGRQAKRSPRTQRTEKKGRPRDEDQQAKERNEEPDPENLVEVREVIATLVRKSARGIVEGMITAARKGQVAPGKYLFEAIGLYPAGVELPKPEDSPAYSLLKRMGLEPKADASEGTAQKDQGRNGKAEKDAVE